ncbi:pygopus homolog 1 [Erpetoichthys calabaricus]|uniref:Pygopus family PHD finger 1 n=1 Tax=Erpetoichthys calabaricus TaxID=27687 RepID=A0A8C4TDV3_ERPCA|nr:pygopus homolog 1 [Erpetoichthys calabaricus]
MSADQDKDALSLKRNRGGDGGFEGLGAPGIHLGSPDKKKRKTNAQVNTFSPLSEYAPPVNLSTDHLVAANPFDDNYNSTSYKPLPSGSPYFSNLNYTGFGGYNTLRMAPNMPQRMPSPYGGSYPARNPHPTFAQHQLGMGFKRPHGFGFIPHDNPNLAGQPLFNNMNPGINFPLNHPFRHSPGESFSQLPTQNMNQNPNSDMASHFGPEMNANLNTPIGPDVETNHSYIQPPNNFSHTSTLPPKQDFSQGPNKSRRLASHQHGQCPEENLNQEGAELKNNIRNSSYAQESNHTAKTTDNINSSHPNNGAKSNSGQSHTAVEVGFTKRSSNKTAALPNRLSHSSSDPIYPCGICMNEVNDDQEAILCEASCQKWFHRVCTGMTETAYNLLTAEASAVWACDTCMENKELQLLRSKEYTDQEAISKDG